MLKKIVAGALILGMLVLPACGKSNFQTHSDNVAKKSLYHDTARKEAVKYGFQALEKVMGFYEAQLKNDQKVNSDKTLFKYTAYDSKHNIVGIYEVADVTSGYVSIVNNMTIANSRERVIREFAPIFQSITKDLVDSGNAPKSWIDVASEFVKHVPLMASMGAMYGLSVAAIDKAGANITNNLSDNASATNTVGNGNKVANGGSTLTDSTSTETNIVSGAGSGNNTTTTTPAPETPAETPETPVIE